MHDLSGYLVGTGTQIHAIAVSLTFKKFYHIDPILYSTLLL